MNEGVKEVVDWKYEHPKNLKQPLSNEEVKPGGEVLDEDDDFLNDDEELDEEDDDRF